MDRIRPAEEKIAEEIMTISAPDAGELALVLDQLVETSEIAELASPGSWAASLLSDGFRLNVGQVEVLVFRNGILRVNLYGSIPSPEELNGYLHPADYKSVSLPQFAFIGSVSQFQRWKSKLIQAHHDFVRLAALSPSGKLRKGTPFARSHSPGLMSYAHWMKSSRSESGHFIAYHSTKVMGHEYRAHGELAFFSAKIGLLKKALGNKVWVVNGTQGDGRTSYTLCGVYIATAVEPAAGASSQYIIRGQGEEFLPTVLLNGFDWFPAFLKSQSNFSLGFNRINNPEVVAAFVNLESSAGKASSRTSWLDPELSDSSLEGSPHLVLHLSRERNRALVQAKKKFVWSQFGRLACEACGFDFAATYGQLGDDFCEVHHRIPLASTEGAVRTTLEDLAVLCSNCHRVIHRSEPMLSVEDLSAICSLKNARVPV